MIIRPSTLHQDTQTVPLLFKEGLGVVEKVSGPGTHHPLPSSAEEGSRVQGWKETGGRAAKGGRGTARRSRNPSGDLPPAPETGGKEQVLLSVVSVRSVVGFILARGEEGCCQ